MTETPVAYISGPISGRPDGNRPAFERAAERLRARGFVVVNPHEVFTEPPPKDPADLPAYWVRAMRVDIKALMDCTHIASLHDWNRSRGAVIENRLALDLSFGRILLDEHGQLSRP